MLLTQSTAQNRPFFLGVTALTPTVQISKNNGAFGAAAGVVSELSGGWYNVALTAADTGTLGPLTYLIAGVGVPVISAYPVDKVVTPAATGGIVIQ
jgi:hypothetical protein